MPNDALATLRRLLLPLPPDAPPDDRARLRAAVALMQRIRLTEREAEAKSLAGHVDDHPSPAVLRRHHFWLLATHLSLIAERMDIAPSPESRAALIADQDSIIGHAMALLRNHPGDVAAFVPSATGITP